MRQLRILIAVTLGCFLVPLIVILALPRSEGDGLAVGQDVPFYSLPWNDNPFYPGEITTLDGKLANWRTVPAAEFCAQCHTTEYKEWVASIHSVSGPDLIYETAIEANEHAHDSRRGREKIRWCDSCHEPLFTLMGEVNPTPAVGPSAAAAEGTSCVVCHTAVAAEPLAGNGALTLDINSINDYFDPALIMAAPAEHARAMQAKTHNPLMGESALCGACHTEIRPVAINGQEPMNLQDTFDEWRRSEYANEGIQCQNCHMNSDPAAYVAALKRGETPEVSLSHRFVGSNYLLTATDLPSNLITLLRGGHPQGDLTTAEWKALLDEQQRLILELMEEAADLRIEAPPAAAAGEEASLRVVVTNSGAGHNLPTGPLDQRFMWLEVKVTDASGRVAYHTGWFNEKTGQVDPKAELYVKLLYDEQGKRITRHILFDADRIEYTRRPIPPKASDSVPYTFTVPAGSQGPLTVEAKLRYNLVLQELVAFALKMDLVVPPIELAEATAEISVR